MVMCLICSLFSLAWFFEPLGCFVLEFAKIIIFKIKFQKTQRIWLSNQRSFCFTHWVAANSLDNGWFVRFNIKNKKKIDLIRTRLNQVEIGDEFFVFCKQIVYKLLPNTFYKTCLVCFMLGWVATPSCAWASGALTESQYKIIVSE